MTEQGGPRLEGSYTVRVGRDGQTTLAATGPTPAAVLAAALAGVLAVYRDETGTPASADEATTALPLRADGVDAGALFATLATELLEAIDHSAYDVRAVRFDGLVRTDEGLTGWGYALAVAGGIARPPMTVEESLVTEEGGVVILRATLRQSGGMN